MSDRTPAGDFDYDTKLWGKHEVDVSPQFLGALRLRYCLDDLKDLGGRVLEVGCGAGGMTRAIKAHLPGLELHGCDFSRRAIFSARQISPRIRFGLADACDLPYEAGAFDGLVMFDVLEHLWDPGRAVAEAWRVLRAGGLFHLYVPCEGGLHTLHGLLALAGWRSKETYGGHVQRFTLSELRKTLTSRGFTIRRVRWSAHLGNQFADVMYFSGLAMRGRNTAASVEGYLEEAGVGFLPSTIRVLKTILAVSSYYESKWLVRVPGSGVHLLCEKEGR